MTELRIPPGVDGAAGWGAATGALTLTSGAEVEVGMTDSWMETFVACVLTGAWRALKYTIVNSTTSTIRARLAATSVGANIDLLESHRPFLRMASLPPCEASLLRPY
jgi:hypothetical protein